MKKNFKYFGITWIVAFVLFNAVTFLIPNEVFGVTRFDKAVFWIAYALIVISFVAELITAYKFVKDDSNEKTFLNIPLLQTGYTAIIFSVIVGLAFMIFPVLPAWLGAIVCILIAGYFIIACVKASTVAEVVAEIDVKVKTQTVFIKALTIDADALVMSVESDEIKEVCKKVYETIRYSDPISNVELAEDENKISIKFTDFSNAVKNREIENILVLSKELIVLLEERNKKCKLLK
ncbi:MAG: hypothetical protein J6B79_02520 [Clostridia bacterium]|nr:hypothetical protein [Clostridia bacterium]